MVILCDMKESQHYKYACAQKIEKPNLNEKSMRCRQCLTTKMDIDFGNEKKRRDY